MGKCKDCKHYVMDGKYGFCKLKVENGQAKLLDTLGMRKANYSCKKDFMKGRESMSIEETIDYINEIRQRKKLTLKFIAKEMGVTQQTVCYWFKHTKEPSLFRLYDLMEVVGIDIILKERVVNE